MIALRIKTLNKNVHFRFACLLGLLLLLIIGRYAFQIDIPRIIFLAIISLIAILGDRDEIVALCICFIPLHESIDFFYALVICLAIYVFKYYRGFRFGANLILLLSIMAWEFLHCFVTSFSLWTYLGYIMPFIVLAIMMASDAESFDYSLIVRSFAWTTCIISAMLLVRVFYFANFDIASALAGLQRMGSDMHSGIEDVTISGGQINPNSLGIIAVLASTGLMQLRFMKVSKKSDIVLMCCMLVLSALSTSRTYLVCLAFMIVLFIFAEKGGIVKKFRLIAVLGFAVIIATILMYILFSKQFEYYISRFFEEDITTGRADAMIVFNKFIFGNSNVMFFGLGLQDYAELIVYQYRVWDNIPHNSIQEIVIAWGIPGLLIFATQIFFMYHESARRNPKQSLVNWIPLMIILFKGIAGQLLTSPYTMLAFAFAYISLCQDFSSLKEGVRR